MYACGRLGRKWAWLNGCAQKKMLKSSESYVDFSSTKA